MNELNHTTEAGFRVQTGHAASPAERDLFSLAMSPFSDLLEAVDKAPAEGPHESVPDRSIQIAELIVGRTVGIIRLGTPNEISQAGIDLAELCMAPSQSGYTGGLANEEAFRLVSGASVTIGSAGRVSSGYEFNLLRKNENGDWPLATKTLSALMSLSRERAADGESYGWVTNRELCDVLEMQGQAKPLTNAARGGLEAQSLIVETQSEWVSGILVVMPHERNIVSRPHVQQLLSAYQGEQQKGQE